MIKSLKIIFITTTMLLITSNISASQKDCSVFKHKFDRKVCEAQNAENANKQETTSSSSSSISEAGTKATGFLKKLGTKLKLKKQKMYREQGD